MSISITYHELEYKSVPNFGTIGVQERFKSEGSMCKLPDKRLKSHSVSREKSKIHHNSIIKQDKSVNKSIKATAVENYSGRLSFKGASTTAPEIGGKVLQSIAKNPLVRKFVEMADRSFLVVEAAVMLVICMARSISVMFMPTDDPEKNKKVAAHAIASAFSGYGTAMLISMPLNKAGKKIVANPSKYFSKNTLKFFNDPSSTTNSKTLVGNKTVDTTQKLLGKIFEMCLVPVRAAITVALLPIIDKNIISKVFGPVQNKKEDYIDPSICFKGTKNSAIKELEQFINGQEVVTCK